MPTGYTYPGPTSVYVPTTEATQQLLVGYSRNEKDFLVAKYSKYVPVKQMKGFFRVWLSQQGSRILTSNDSEHVWEDNAARPDGQRNTEASTVLPFLCTRRAFDVSLGDLTLEQADYQILAAHSQQAAMTAMTSRTLRTYNALSTYSGWGSNTAAVNGTILPANQNWFNGTSNASFTGTTYVTGPNIKKSFNFAQNQITLATFGVVDPGQSMVVLAPNLAQGMSQSAEIQDFIKQSEFALAQLRGDAPNQNRQWGLPTVLYAEEILVEKTVRITSRQNAVTTVQAFIYPISSAFMLSRPGELEGIEGSPDFSTIQNFFYKDELTLENFHDPQNKREVVSVVTNDSPTVVSPLSGFYFTGTN